MSQMIFVNLPVADLAKVASPSWRRLARVNEPKFTDETAAMMRPFRQHQRHASDP